MKINNEKGHVALGVFYAGHIGAALITPAVFKLAFIAITLAAAWHIPAWEQAKATHTEAQYQAQKMWPQQLFAKLPHGNYVAPDPVAIKAGGLRAEILSMQN